MTTTYGIGELDEAYEGISDEAYEENDEGYEEAVRRPGGFFSQAVPTAGRQSAYRPRANPAAASTAVTQAQLQLALARVSSQIGTNSTAIKTLDGRVRGVSREQERATAALRKEVVERKKHQEALSKEIQSTRELAAILPIIAKDNPMLGLLLMGGGGGSLFGGTGGTSDSTSNSTSNLVMMALVMGPLLSPPKSK